MQNLILLIGRHPLLICRHDPCELVEQRRFLPIIQPAEAARRAQVAPLREVFRTIDGVSIPLERFALQPPHTDRAVIALKAEE